MTIDRETLENLLWEASRERLFVSREEFMSSLRVWDIKPVEIDGLLAFITLQDGPKFHFHSLKSAKPLTRRLICQILQPIIDVHGFAETRTPHEDTRQQRFNELLGWEEVGRDDFDVIYRIKRVRGA